MPGEIPLGYENVDLTQVSGVVVLFEMKDGTQKAWRVDELRDLSWDGIAWDADVRVRGRFQRMAKNPESREIERRMHAVLGQGGYDPDDGRQSLVPGR